jgi:signal transduction histidine kinase
MKISPEAFDYLQPQTVPDKHLLVGLLDFLMHKKICDGYSFVLVPQLGKDQGRLIKVARYRRSVPVDVRKESLQYTDAHDVAIPSSRSFLSHEKQEYYIIFASIASAYDINIGAISIVSKTRLSRRQVFFLLNVFESIISLRKKAVALIHHGEFLQIDQTERRSLDRAVGDIVHKSVNPYETLIFVPNLSNSCYDVAYSSRASAFSIPDGANPVGQCSRSREIIIINDLSNKASIIKKFGADLANREFIDHRRYLSSIYVPVYRDDECYCVIACYFLRKNAVSRTERDILMVAARILGDYYRLWTERSALQSRIRESDAIYDKVRLSLLIADIMHDASEDLITARGQIGMLNPRTDIESRCLSAAKESLRELINASRHFRSFFTKVKDKEDTLLYRIKHLSQEGTFDTINISNLVDELGKKYERGLITNKITLKNNCPRSYEFKAIKYGIKRALDNAIKNSMAHLRDKSHIKREIIVTLNQVAAGLKPELQERHVELIVNDNGFGIEPEYLNRVTEPFFSRRGGMGLGLPIIQAACEAHGGRLDISSDWGRGFRVVMSIPVPE